MSISIIDTTAAAEEMTAQLAAEGLDVRVQTAPVTPQLVGTWVGVGSDGSTDEVVFDAVTAQALGYADDIAVPRGASGLTLTVGVPTEPGQAAQIIGMRNAFAPGGPLECSTARGATVAAATTMLTEQGYSTQVVRFPTFEPVAAKDTDLVPTVFYDDATPSHLLLVATDPGDATLQARRDLGFSPRQAASLDCP
ncbi:hypothetical protein [Pseudokineococcus sp. 1T1Z-3]|uniref:hypothetical protein n=1 Tax=Pseudokineococcus sp. 1T1Z-3 TaxID=3132745 RepID=UPI0030DB6B5F